MSFLPLLYQEREILFNECFNFCKGKNSKISLIVYWFLKKNQSFKTKIKSSKTIDILLVEVEGVVSFFFFKCVGSNAL
jgi:hypothetical protein